MRRTLGEREPFMLDLREATRRERRRVALRVRCTRPAPTMSGRQVAKAALRSETEAIDRRHVVSEEALAHRIERVEEDLHRGAFLCRWAVASCMSRGRKGKSPARAFGRRAMRLKA